VLLVAAGAFTASLRAAPRSAAAAPQERGRHERRAAGALREATLAINQVKRVALDAADGAVQVFGGHGYIREYLPELHLRNARGLSAFECIALV
jgi:alkylation response protein AidB-like acyl-CoA dehydrogenase